MIERRVILWRARDDQEPLRPLELGEPRERRARAGEERLRGVAPGGRQPRQLLPRDEDGRRDERAAVAEEHRPLERRGGGEGLLHRLGRELLPGGEDEQVLLAPLDAQRAVGPQPRQVAGAEVAVRGEGRLGVLGLQEAGEHERPTELQLAVGGEPESWSGEMSPTSPGRRRPSRRLMEMSPAVSVMPYISTNGIPSASKKRERAGAAARRRRRGRGSRRRAAAGARARRGGRRAG